MLLSQSWMILPCYLGMDRILFEPFMHCARHAYNLEASRRIRILACILTGVVRIAACILPVHVAFETPTILLILLVAADVVTHRFGETADAIPPTNEQNITAIKFCRVMSLSQLVVLIIAIGLALHGVKPTSWFS